MEHPAKEVQTDPTPGPAKEEKALVPVPPSEVKPVETKSLPVVQKIVDPVKQKSSGGSGDRDIALADVEKEKKLSYVKAWEESEKSKAENKAQKNVSSVAAWENSKKAALEAKLRKKEEQLERKKAEYGEKMKNKVALIHKNAEEKRAMVEAQRGEEILKAQETAAKFRATGNIPKKILGCF